MEGILIPPPSQPVGTSQEDGSTLINNLKAKIHADNSLDKKGKISIKYGF